MDLFFSFKNYHDSSHYKYVTTGTADSEIVSVSVISVAPPRLLGIYRNSPFQGPRQTRFSSITEVVNHG